MGSSTHLVSSHREPRSPLVAIKVEGAGASHAAMIGWEGRESTVTRKEGESVLVRSRIRHDPRVESGMGMGWHWVCG